MIDIALIDTGINNSVPFMEIRNFIVEERECKEFHYDEKISDGNFFSHGLKCGLILNKFCPNGKITSIKILNNKGIGMLDKLQPALEWCVQNHIQLVNLSLGTTHFKDLEVLKKIVNHYANRGMIIVAATANSGYRAFPSSFANVLGVAAGDKLTMDFHMYLEKGVDIIAPFNHDLIVYNIPIQLNKSNSYAAPYITALIGKFMEHETYKNISEVKKKLFSYVSQKKEMVCYPDWIEKAWVSKQCRKSKADYYFTQINKDYRICKADIDTVVLKNSKEFLKYKKSGKHIVYLGQGKITNVEKTVHFWSREQRIIQILNSNKRNADIDIPIICCLLDRNQDELLWLSKLKYCFNKDGYNVYAISKIIESVLYDLEYLPNEMCTENNREKMHDFLYWQTYYNQTDAILVAMNHCDRNVYRNRSDILVEVTGQKNFLVTICCEGKEKLEKKINVIDEFYIQHLYKDILGLLTEEIDE